MKITFIVPCFNADKIIIKNYKKLNNFIKKHKIKKKIIYINDGSQDNTLKKLKEIKDKDVKILNNKNNLGKSKSIINALELVRTKNVVLIDCDLPYFKYLKKVLDYLKEFNLVIVNRKLKESSEVDTNKNLYKILRNLISNFLGKIIENRLKLGVKGDTQAGLKAFRINDDFKKNKFFSKYFFFDIELINFFKKKGFKIKLVPVRFKISDQSSIKLFSFKNFKIIFELLKILKKKNN